MCDWVSFRSINVWNMTKYQGCSAVQSWRYPFRLHGGIGVRSDAGLTVSNITEKLSGSTLSVPEVTQSEVAQKQKLKVVLSSINQVPTRRGCWHGPALLLYATVQN